MQLAISKYSCCSGGEVQLVVLVWLTANVCKGQTVLQVTLGYASPAGMQKLGEFDLIKDANYSSEYPCDISSIFVFTSGKSGKCAK